nr:insecticidal protein IPD102Fo [uncultured bacterium]
MSISIKVYASIYEGQSRISYGGRDVSLISQQERNTFKLNDNQLKNAAKRVFGRRPNDAFLRSPTPWNLYENNRWMQTQRSLFIQGVRLIERSSSPVIVANQEFVNSSSVPAKFNAAIEQNVSNTVSSQWSTGGTLSIGQTIKVEVGFLGTGVGSETSLSYEQSWGISGERSQSITVGTSSGVEVELQPGQPGQPAPRPTSRRGTVPTSAMPAAPAATPSERPGDSAHTAPAPGQSPAAETASAPVLWQ